MKLRVVVLVVLLSGCVQQPEYAGTLRDTRLEVAKEELTECTRAFMWRRARVVFPDPYVLCHAVYRAIRDGKTPPNWRRHAYGT